MKQNLSIHGCRLFDEIKSRGVEDIFFISMDGVSGLEQGAKEIFKRCCCSKMYCSSDKKFFKICS